MEQAVLSRARPGNGSSPAAAGSLRPAPAAPARAWSILLQTAGVLVLSQWSGQLCSTWVFRHPPGIPTRHGSREGCRSAHPGCSWLLSIPNSCTRVHPYSTPSPGLRMGYKILSTSIHVFLEFTCLTALHKNIDLESPKVPMCFDSQSQKSFIGVNCISIKQSAHKIIPTGSGP